ncbi:transposase family protein [Streptomyces sp. NPDC054840]
MSRALPGRPHDLPVARAHGLVQADLTWQILVLADKYQGGHRTPPPAPLQRRELSNQYKQFNREHAHLRAAVERGFAPPQQWRIFRKARCSTNRIGHRSHP